MDRTGLGTPTSDGQALLERLRALPGGPELIELAEQRGGGVELVGGAVRDLMLGNRPRELDAVVAAHVEETARELGGRLGGEVTLHERFGTALVRAPDAFIDLATMRAESYATPGALPDVRPGTPEEDLMRRDFTVNAIALGLAGERRGQLRALPGALEDLQARRLRVLHDNSFLDDPTRILRLVRYATRLGFEVEPHTADLLAAAVRAGALKTVTGARLGAELRLALEEATAVPALAEMDRLGILSAWEDGVSFDESLVRLALEIMPEDGSPALLLATALLLELTDQLDREETEPAMRGFTYDLEMPAGEADHLFGAAITASFAIDTVDDIETTDDLIELMRDAPVESLALAAAACELRDGPGSFGRATIEEWLSEQRHVELQISGDDLIAAGVPEGPEIGMRLEETYKAVLEQRIPPGRQFELRVALRLKL